MIFRELRQLGTPSQWAYDLIAGVMLILFGLAGTIIVYALAYG